jgi:hypothetical protein
MPPQARRGLDEHSPVRLSAVSNMPDWGGEAGISRSIARFVSEKLRFPARAVESAADALNVYSLQRSDIPESNFYIGFIVTQVP